VCGAATSTDASTRSTTSSTTSSFTSVSSYETSTTTDDDTAAQTISDTAEAAEASLATLSDEEREAVLFAYYDESRTTSWSNFPTIVQRAGLNLTACRLGRRPWPQQDSPPRQPVHPAARRPHRAVPNPDRGPSPPAPAFAEAEIDAIGP